MYVVRLYWNLGKPANPFEKTVLVILTDSETNFDERIITARDLTENFIWNWNKCMPIGYLKVLFFELTKIDQIAQNLML